MPICPAYKMHSRISRTPVLHEYILGQRPIQYLNINLLKDGLCKKTNYSFVYVNTMSKLYVEIKLETINLSHINYAI